MPKNAPGIVALILAVSLSVPAAMQTSLHDTEAKIGPQMEPYGSRVAKPEDGGRRSLRFQNHEGLEVISTPAAQIGPHAEPFG